MYVKDSNRTFAFRDPAGSWPLFFYIDEDFNLFLSTELFPLINFLDSPPVPNLAFFNIFYSDFGPSNFSSPIKKIMRLEPGTIIDDYSGDISIKSYWTPKKQLGLRQYKKLSQDKSSTYLELLTKAVKDRIPTNQKPAAVMSGGLDSPAIVALVCRSSASPKVFSLISDTYLGKDERLRIEDFSNEFRNIEIDKVDIGNYWPLRRLKSYFPAVRQGPCFNPCLNAMRTLYNMAGNQGYQTVLTGVGGNLFDGSQLVVADLLCNFKIKATYSSLKDMGLSNFFYTGIVPLFVHLSPDLFTKNPISKEIDFSPDWFLGNGTKADSSLNFPDIYEKRLSIIDSIMIKDTYKSFFNPITDFYLSTERIASLRDGVEIRHPFLDSRVISFLLRANSWDIYPNTSKGLHKKAFDDILPESILNQKGNVHLGRLQNEAFRKKEKTKIKELVGNVQKFNPSWLDQNRVKKVVESYFQGNDSKKWSVWKIASTGFWIEEINIY